MATFLFVHGSFQGAWCWREVVQRLQHEGYRCVTFDLPGHGDDMMAPEKVTFQDYVAAVLKEVEALPDAPILVGHSMTAIISRAAELIPTRICALVYVSGFLIPSGKTMMEMVNDFDSRYLAELIWSTDRKTARLSAFGAKEFLFSLCSPSVLEQILPRLGAEPAAPFETRLETTPDRFGRVPRYYVECERDRIIPISVQRRMHAAIPCKRVYTIDTGHAPFFSAPEELTSILLEIAQAESPPAC
jgi:pimeloyl-ACP methyl ester carboxylesterase